MAKRTRGANRPGQRPANSARTQSRPAARPSGGLSVAEETRAAELESAIVAQSKVADTARASARDRRSVESPVRPRGQGTLAIRAAEEYGYVARDVRRIVRWGLTMAGVLAVLFVLIDVMHVVTL
jgi:hypothetical protein